jgi:hypothetical protein
MLLGSVTIRLLFLVLDPVSLRSILGRRLFAVLVVNGDDSMEFSCTWRRKGFPRCILEKKKKERKEEEVDFSRIVQYKYSVP